MPRADNYPEAADKADKADGDRPEGDLAGGMLRRPVLVGDLGGPAQQLAYVTDMMRELSRQSDPQELVLAYSRHMRRIMRQDGFVSLSRRGLSDRRFRVTRSTNWDDQDNADPWRESDRLPLLEGGVLADLIYAGRPAVLNDFTPDPADPAYEYLKVGRSLMAMPLFDNGEAVNMAVQLRKEPDGFDLKDLPGVVWMSNLFGRATQNLVLTRELGEAKAALDREVSTIADMQRSLLTTDLPQDHGLKLAYHWRPSDRAGGDFFNVVPTGDGRLGLFVGDVSGHGVAAAVLTAIAHAIMHTAAGPPRAPGEAMAYLNGHLCRRYTKATAQFITAFFGIYDPNTRRLTYSSAGHPPPRVVNGCGGDNMALDGARGLPLGVADDADYDEVTVALGRGDVLVLYTDGITEARAGRKSELFGVERLDLALDSCGPDPDEIIRRINAAVGTFTNDAPPGDDQTLLVAKIE